MYPRYFTSEEFFDEMRKEYYKNPDNTREDAIIMSLEL